ncbi:RagB/SusD family nutrient uptake outer membrane protein [Gemmatimonas sp.]|uniref:RagB/SusD family nutrient uptake outer membrane protein n=1 Tax=Gemmatimonas sp. TaxID=1962908 RepID=UPI00286DDD91|nr:RagB/SusD family nutrient uptake outer membrane protein [Gemmatimonas sp.]
MTTSISSGRAFVPRHLLRVAAPLCLLSGLSGCALDATNPGPIRAEALNSPSALSSLVNGSGRDLAEALNWVTYTGAAATREIFPAGSTAAFGISVLHQNGKLVDNDGDNYWNFSQRARWTSEDAVTRIKSVLGTPSASSATLAQALVWAGYSNRHLGENFCEGVINGGAPGPHTVYFERAETYFTEAITVATAANNANLVSAATAGRASVRLLRNNTAGAATDAATVASTYVYRMPYYQNELDQYNRIFWASANQPYRAHTVWNTYIETYRRATRDPRVPYDSSLTVLVGDAAVGSLGRVRWYFQTKYPTLTSNINLSSGWEMRLIEAELKLIAGDLNGALTSINGRRIALSLTPVTATSLTEGWAALKRERGIELWLEGRRLGDLRRWAALARPGALDPKEEIPGRDLCFATPLSEKQTNLNFPR